MTSKSTGRLVHADLYGGGGPSDDKLEVDIHPVAQEEKKPQPDEKPEVDVNSLVQQGVNHLQTGAYKEAYGCFQVVYEALLNRGDLLAVTICALNLGTALLALQSYSAAIAQLEKNIPKSREDCGAMIFGDYHFNLGLAYQLEGQAQNAIEHFQLAYEEYDSVPSGVAVKAEALSRVAKLYEDNKDFVRAAKNYGQVAEVHVKTGDYWQQVQSFVKQARCLLQCGLTNDAMQALNRAGKTIQKAPQDENLVRIYIEMSLMFFQVKDLDNSHLCLQLALPLCGNSKYTQAVVQKNLGAICNSRAEFHGAITCFNEAANLFGQLGSHLYQAHCLAGLAFSYTQLHKFPEAAELFQQAYQLASDLKDIKLCWQAAEGLGCIALVENNPDQAKLYFEDALNYLKQAPDPLAQRRIMEKLEGVKTSTSVVYPSGRQLPMRRTIQGVLGFQQLNGGNQIGQSGLLASARSQDGSINPVQEAILQQQEAMQRNFQLTRRISKRSKYALSYGQTVTPRTLLHTNSNEDQLLYMQRLAEENEEVGCNPLARFRRGNEEEYYRPPSRPPSNPPQLSSHDSRKKKAIMSRLLLKNQTSHDSTLNGGPKPLGESTKAIPSRPVMSNVVQAAMQADEETEESTETETETEEESGENKKEEETELEESETLSEEDEDEEDEVDQQNLAEAYQKELTEQEHHEQLAQPSTSQQTRQQQVNGSANFQERVKKVTIRKEVEEEETTEEETEDESEDDTDDETEEDTETDTNDEDDHKPPLPNSSPHTTKVLVNTYETPVPVGMNNYFRQAQVKKEVVPDETTLDMHENTLYASIGAVGTSQRPESPTPPPLPKRPSELSRAEEEEMLRQHHEQQQVTLPSQRKSKKKNQSKACTVM